MDYAIIRSNRRSIALQICPDGRVVVRCGYLIPRWQIDRFVQSKKDWINRHQPKSPPLMPLGREQVQELIEQAKPMIAQKVRAFAPVVGVSYGRVTVRAQRTRWGSCSSKGNLNFNCLLALAPDRVADYVVVHELCHRKELNHSARFWAEVEKILPDYRVSRQWLKENAWNLLCRLPEKPTQTLQRRQ